MICLKKICFINVTLLLLQNKLDFTLTIDLRFFMTSHNIVKVNYNAMINQLFILIFNLTA